MPSIVYPFHYQVYQREGVKWFVMEGGSVFYNGASAPMKLKHVARQFGLTEQQVVIELFRINGGKPGYYLANLRDKKYYYCGLHWEDVRVRLQSLGIGRADPLERR